MTINMKIASTRRAVKERNIREPKFLMTFEISWPRLASLFFLFASRRQFFSRSKRGMKEISAHGMLTVPVGWTLPNSRRPLIASWRSLWKVPCVMLRESFSKESLASKILFVEWNCSGTAKKRFNKQTSSYILEILLCIFLLSTIAAL